MSPKFRRVILIVLESYFAVITSATVAVISVSLQASLWMNLTFDIASPSLGIAFMYMIAAAGSKASMNGLVSINRAASIQVSSEMQFASVAGGIILPPVAGSVTPALASGGTVPAPAVGGDPFAPTTNDTETAQVKSISATYSYNTIARAALEGYVTRGAAVNLQFEDIAGSTLSRSDSKGSYKHGSIIVLGCTLPSPIGFVFCTGVGATQDEITVGHPSELLSVGSVRCTTSPLAQICPAIIQILVEAYETAKPARQCERHLRESLTSRSVLVCHQSRDLHKWTPFDCNVSITEEAPADHLVRNKIWRSREEYAARAPTPQVLQIYRSDAKDTPQHTRRECVILVRISKSPMFHDVVTPALRTPIFVGMDASAPTAAGGNVCRRPCQERLAEIGHEVGDAKDVYIRPLR
ncbi:hypothetical protein NM688_g8962 [Phlebia brevispora]|uniref:Uncharacterized protein n=1 Tax=Phlebia brevispora TaxID=194682 RepID=A0ACC1RL31_9APHY|nr:hypothetical protein NM688_g8962 [Phlebia brevispora]